jgi:hypothetical protein
MQRHLTEGDSAAYVERLVVATIIEAFRGDWRNVQAAAETKRAAGDNNGAAEAVKAFHASCLKRRAEPATSFMCRWNDEAARRRGVGGFA